jgi:hypothetical protein
MNRRKGDMIYLQLSGFLADDSVDRLSIAQKDPTRPSIESFIKQHPPHVGELLYIHFVEFNVMKLGVGRLRQNFKIGGETCIVAGVEKWKESKGYVVTDRSATARSARPRPYAPHGPYHTHSAGTHDVLEFFQTEKSCPCTAHGGVKVRTPHRERIEQRNIGEISFAYDSISLTTIVAVEGSSSLCYVVV